MKPTLLYAVAVGALTFAVLLFLDALRIGEHSVWRAAIAGGISAGLVFWIGPKLIRGATR